MSIVTRVQRSIQVWQTRFGHPPAELHVSDKVFKQLIGNVDGPASFMGIPIVRNDFQAKAAGYFFE